MNKVKTPLIIILSLVFIGVFGFGVYNANKNKVDVVVKEFEFDLLNEEDYKIISKEIKGKNAIYNIITDFKLNLDESEFLSNKIYSEDLKDNKKVDTIEMNIIKDEESAKNYNGNLEDLTQQIYVSKEDKTLSIDLREINIVEGGVSSVPTDYKINSIKENKDITIVEATIPSNLDNKQSISQMKIISQAIKDLNKDKDIKDIHIKGYFEDNETLRYEYYSKFNNVILYCEETK